jgi:hypothetical protein
MMKVRHVLVMVAALMALAACRGERATVTGSYGAGVVAGQVAVTGMHNNSPAGVQVSVRGTGMATTLAEDGAFTFAGVPENAELVFRRADGIEAVLGIEANAGFLNISLSATSATQSSSKRRSGGGGEKLAEIEGIVRSASATELVVFTSHQQEVTILLDAQTIIRKGRDPVNAADLVAGARVHVKARKANDVYTAVLVIVQDEDGADDGEPRDGKEYEGLVRSASATELVILDSHGQEVTFVIDAATVIRKGNTPVAAEDLKEGDRVHVKATTAADGTKTAVLVIVQNTKGGDGGGPREAKEYEGVVLSASATELVILDSHQQEVTFVIDAATEIRKGDTPVAATDLHAGDRVHVRATTAADGTKTAILVIVQNTRH